MAGKEGKRTGNSIARIVFVALSILFQVAWLLVWILWLNEQSVWISLITSILSLLVVLRLYSTHKAAAWKLPWIMLIMALPVMGLSLYLMVTLFGDLNSTGKRLKQLRRQTRDHLPHTETTCGENNPAQEYLHRCGEYPAYKNTQVSYYAHGAEAFERMKQELQKAERFIFLEYFIVSEGSAFRELEQILIAKARQGVEVRFLYDDIGSIGYVNLSFVKKMNDAGIHCQVFNPALPILNLFMNHRDHRKITVIDGKVGFTGGYNLSDEYFGRAFPYGEWKDTGICMEGEAVRELTAMFLQMWNIREKQAEQFDRYLQPEYSIPEASGFVQPFADDPLEPERLAENAYLNLIYAAKESLYITTPYLIITDEMNNALGLAAKRGVDVRIITPGIPDKKTIYQVTRSYYPGLVSQGVRIFEYTPGFVHAKQCVCDGKTACIGTSNLDYRSLYLHFENNVMLYDCDAVQAMAQDFASMFPRCQEVTEQYRSGRGAVLLLWQCLLRLFATLM